MEPGGQLGSLKFGNHGYRGCCWMDRPLTCREVLLDRDPHRCFRGSVSFQTGPDPNPQP